MTKKEEFALRSDRPCRLANFVIAGLNPFAELRLGRTQLRESAMNNDTLPKIQERKKCREREKTTLNIFIFNPCFARGRLVHHAHQRLASTF
jgi:hypothetical protein